MHRFVVALTVGLALLPSSPAALSRPLGRVVFPNSCSALAKAGDPARGRRAYRQFLANWRLADPNLPELAEARAALR